MAAVVREIERKYEVAGADAPRLDEVGSAIAGVASVSARTEESLDAVYYDTEDLRLLRGGVTLRHRSGGVDAGWHLKLPAGKDARDEIRLPPGEPGGGVPGELAALVRGRTRGAALMPVVRICTVRGRRQLLDEAGRPLAEIAADDVSAEPMDGSAATSWQELEVELVTGDRKLLMEVDAQLRAAGARPARTQTKLARALGDRLRDAGGSQVREAARLTADSPARDVVFGYLGRQVDAITHFDPLVRRDRPDAVHQMRVATRRARSALRAFGEIVDRGRTRDIRGELRWLAAVLGRARDAEVLLARLESDLAAIPAELMTGPVRDRVTAHFSREGAQAQAAVVRELDGRRYLSLLDALDALIAHPPLTELATHPAAKVLRKPVRKAGKSLKRALGQIPDQDRDEAIHEARKAAKRARYAAEAAMPALGGRARKQAAQAKALQTSLGDHHDSVVARALVRSLASEARAAGEETFTYGVMYEREACQARDIERTLAEIL